MTKEEREALISESKQLDNVFTILEQASFPGKFASPVLQAQQFIQSLWLKNKEKHDVEAKRIEDLVNETATLGKELHEKQKVAS